MDGASGKNKGFNEMAGVLCMLRCCGWCRRRRVGADHYPLYIGCPQLRTD
jgi:hypothetical protein